MIIFLCSLPFSSISFVQHFSNKWIQSLKYNSGRTAKYPFTVTVTSSFNTKRFPLTNLSLRIGESQNCPNLANRVGPQISKFSDCQNTFVGWCIVLKKMICSPGLVSYIFSSRWPKKLYLVFTSYWFTILKVIN